MNDEADAVDALSELFLRMRMQGVSYWRLRLGPPFGVNFQLADGPRFHFIGKGEVSLLVPGEQPQRLKEGDAVLIPRALPHQLVSDPRAQLRDFASFPAEHLCTSFCDIRAVGSNGAEDEVVLLSGSMELDAATMHPLVALMPASMTVRGLLDRQPQVAAFLTAMETELTQERPGSIGILARLADIVASLIVRGWIERGCDEASGVITALRDPRLARVLVALHKNPGHDWDIVSMAKLMGTSRSVFSERFRAVVGVSPLRYVADLRMRLAAQWLKQDALPVAEVAHRLGYGSQAAFARAFKRVIGSPPGRIRRAA